MTAGPSGAGHRPTAVPCRCGDRNPGASRFASSRIGLPDRSFPRQASPRESRGWSQRRPGSRIIADRRQNPSVGSPCSRPGGAAGAGFPGRRPRRGLRTGLADGPLRGLPGRRAAHRPCPATRSAVPPGPCARDRSIPEPARSVGGSRDPGTDGPAGPRLFGRDRREAGRLRDLPPVSAAQRAPGTLSASASRNVRPPEAACIGERNGPGRRGDGPCPAPAGFL